MDSEREDAPRRWPNMDNIEAAAYDARYEAGAARGENVHGEADFVERFHPHTVLDAGCGTGRIAIELARRGVVVTGVDRDAGMLRRAREKAPDLEWHLADLATVALPGPFDLVLLAGNVMIFLTPGTEEQVLANLTRHLVPGGRLVAGFQLSIGYLPLTTYDRLAAVAGLTLAARYATWECAPWTPASTYAVSVHTR